MPSQEVLVALIVAGSSTSSPLLLAFLTSRSRRKEKAGDYARQDLVAAKAAEAAELLLAANERVARQTAKADAETQVALGAIHRLVNSNLTSAQRRELAATRAMLASMREVIDMKRDRDVAVKPETLTAIAEVERRIGELSRELTHKIEETVAVASVSALAQAAEADAEALLAGESNV